MNTARNGKIAHLPYEVREQVNRALRAGLPGKQLLDCLNGLPSVMEMLANDFGGEPITKQNLSAWRQGGYAEWEARQVLLADARELDKYGEDIEKSGSDRLVERLTTVLVGRLGSLALKWDGSPNQEHEAQLASLGKLSRFVVMLQRGVERSARMQMAKQKHEWDGVRFTQELKGWIGEYRAAEEEGPVLIELVKQIMKNVGLDYDKLKKRAEERKGKNKDGGLKVEDGGDVGRTETGTGRQRKVRRRKRDASHPALGTGAPQLATCNLKPETPTTQVVESRPVKVGQGVEKSEARNQKSEGKGGGVHPAMAGRPTQETLNPEPRTLNVEQKRPEPGMAQWN